MMTNARCSMFTVIPFSGVGNSAPILNIQKDITSSLILIANLNSIIFDFITRQSIGGGNFNFYIVKQLTAFSPEFYNKQLEHYIIPRVFELLYTAWDLQAFSNE